MSLRKGREFELNLAHQFVDTEAREFRPQRAGVEARHIEQRAEDFLDRLERGIDVVDQPAVFAAAALDQARDIKPGGVERLQDVVAGGREKLGFGNIGGVGFAFGVGERGVETRQFLGAFPHAAFQRLIRPLEGLGGFDARG